MIVFHEGLVSKCGDSPHIHHIALHLQLGTKNIYLADILIVLT